jgi:lysophospholipase L1-like esterase
MKSIRFAKSGFVGVSWLVPGAVLLAAQLAPEVALGAAGQSRTILPADRSASGTVTYTAFGDSVTAGFCGPLCQSTRPYTVVFAEYLADALDVEVEYRGRANSGYVASQIYDDIHAGRAELANASIVSVEACGNDFINARNLYKVSFGCSTRVFEDAVSDCLHYMPLILDRLIQHSPASGVKIYGMAGYYPGLENDRGYKKLGCSKNLFDIMLPYVAEVNHQICAQASARGVKCVDAFAAFNVADSDRAAVALVPGESMEEYRARILAAKHLITDGSRKRTAQGSADYILWDDIHPTSDNTSRSGERNGHNRLGLEQFQLGLDWTTK